MELSREVLPVGASCEEHSAEKQAGLRLLPQTLAYYKETGCNPDLPAFSLPKVLKFLGILAVLALQMRTLLQ